jgi:multicomponent Na+:H+ antiporter subunit E
MALVKSEEQAWRGWQGTRIFLNRLLLCSAVWWMLSGGAAESWLVGAPAVVAAALLSSCMLPPLRWSMRGAVRFWSYFLVASLRGGIDVAARALHWRLPLDPGIVEHLSRVSLPAARVSVANTVSLLPGTLAADMDRKHLFVHALDAGTEIRESLELTEQRVAHLFSLELEVPEVDRGLR